VQSVSAGSARVRVVRLVTIDQRFGCRTWHGSYQVVRRGGRWLAARADIKPRPCSP
jgi:hypothetical protein